VSVKVLSRSVISTSFNVILALRSFLPGTENNKLPDIVNLRVSVIEVEAISVEVENVQSY